MSTPASINLGGVRVLHAVEGDLRRAEITGNRVPCPRDVVGHNRPSRRGRKYQRLDGWLPGAERDAHLELLPSMITEPVNHDLRAADVSPAGPRLRRLEADAVGFGSLKRFAGCRSLHC